jgi:hypothetical protein
LHGRVGNEAGNPGGSDALAITCAAVIFCSQLSK